MVVPSFLCAGVYCCIHTHCGPDVQGRSHSKAHGQAVNEYILHLFTLPSLYDESHSSLK